jgi:hypothetical protein
MIMQVACASARAAWNYAIQVGRVVLIQQRLRSGLGGHPDRGLCGEFGHVVSKPGCFLTSM